jgi:thioredoxin-dependent peroxiredoxin
MLGKPVPDFSLASIPGTTFELSALCGEKLSCASTPEAKMRFPFELLSDPDEAVCKQFAVMKLKNLYGNKVRGIERSPFVVDAKGVLAHEWRGVKVPGHAQEVSNFVKAL